MSGNKTEVVLFKDYVNEGLPSPDNFVVSSEPVPELTEDGKLLVELLYVSVDPYMRGRMHNAKSYVPSFQPGKPLNGYAMGVVKQSKAGNVKEGDMVAGAGFQWQQLQVLPAASLPVVDAQLLKDAGLPASVYLGALGMTGMTAYCGLERIGKPKAGETVFVSGAAGAVGLVVGQLCKNVYGCTVVGSAGSDDKVALLKKYGYDAAFNYKKVDTAKALSEFCPKGIDVYWDNVGGATLEAVLDVANTFARIVACGSISGYNDPPEKRHGVKNLFNIVGKRIVFQGMIVGDFAKDMREEFITNMSKYVREGKVHHVEHNVTGGLKAAGQAFIDMMGGGNIGKTVVQCAQDPYRK